MAEETAQLRIYTIAEGRMEEIVRYDGPGSFEEAEAAYYASPERAALSPDPAEHILHADTRMLTPLA